jgi:spore germination protein
MSPFYQTQQFLNNLSQFTYTIASRDMIKQPITTDDQNKLSQLHVYAKQLYGQLDRLQKTVIQQRLKWTDAEKAYAANQNKGHLKNPIVDGFQQLDKSVGNYKELDWGPTITGTVPQAHLATSQRPIKTPTKIRQLVIQKFNLQPHTAIQLKANGNGHYFKSYSVKTTDADGHTILADFAKAGGDMLWFSNRRPVGKTTVTDMRAVEEAKQWLAAWHMPTFEPINQDRYDGVLVITMAELKQGVLHIPHRLTVQVALDNGEVIGMQASEFVMASHQPISIQPKLTLLQAKQHLRTNFQVKTVRLVTIADKAGNEVLCYAFQGQINSTKYRIYLDATTGDERQIEPIRT